MLIFKNKKLLVAIILVVLLLLFFPLRSFMFHYTLKKVEQKLATRELKFNYEKAELKGLRSAEFINISITDSLSDTVFYSEKLTITPKISRLITGKLGISEFHLWHAQLTLDTAILKSKSHINDDSVSLSHHGYNQKLQRAFAAFFDYVPTTLEIEDFNFYYLKKKDFSIKVPHLKIAHKKVEGFFVSSDSLGSSLCNISGNYVPSDNYFNFRLKGENGYKYHFPYLMPKLNTLAAFDSLQVEFNLVSESSDEIQVKGLLQVDNLTINNKKISPQNVVSQHCGLNFSLIAGENYLELDSTSQVFVNDFAFHTAFKFEKDSHRLATLRIPYVEFEAQKLFASMPEGLFSSIREMKVSGNLSYMLDFDIDLDLPDSIHFNSDMDAKGFKIKRMGNANLYLMNDTFSHRVYNPDGSSRVLKISPEAAGFVPLNEISSYLQYSLQTSEDGGFFYHNGFNEEALAGAISTDIKEKRFKRGGSTISMQLVKNLYLTRNKTISRKLEEIFMTWMIENLRMVSKERMYEVYLNIIEWGPNVWGIKEASNFYFGKKPSELSLKESIFLASIVPSPRSFKYSFDENGNLKDLLSSYYKNVSSIMLRRGQINANDTIDLRPEVKLAKPAKRFLEKDTTNLEVEEELF